MPSIKFEIPPELVRFLEEDPQNQIKLLLVFELYRENKLSLRQAADILKLTYREMQETMAKNKIFIKYGKNELDDEFAHGFSIE
jgi:predicted HTH domain antitoxin